MTIKEVERNLNVPRATVRFYEKEGLFSPTRGENGYREYSEEDVVRFEKATILEYFTIEHNDGKIVDNFPKAFIKIALMALGFCGGWCLLEWFFGDFNAGTFREAILTWLGMLVIEIVVAIPTFFYLRKHPEAKKKKVQF